VLNFIRDFLSRRRRMREFVAAGREHHAMKPFVPEWVDTIPMDPKDLPNASTETSEASGHSSGADPSKADRKEVASID